MSERSDVPIVSPVALPGKSPKSDDHERRVGARYPFTAAAEVCDLRSRARVTGRCSDLSFGGCYVDTLSPFAVGTVVKIRMERDKRKFEAAAVVTYAHVQMGMGLAFTDISRGHQEVLRSWIADASGEQVVGPEGSSPPPENRAAEGDANVRLVMNELITLLVRRKIITDNEGTELLRQLFR